MSTVMTLRVPDAAAQAIKEIAKRQKRSVSQVGAIAIEEWTRMQRFPGIEFRSNAGERTACVRGRIEVWQVAMVANGYGGDIDQTAEHLCLTADQVKEAMGYYSAHGDEIDALPDSNNLPLEDLTNTIPSLEVITIPVAETT